MTLAPTGRRTGPGRRQRRAERRRLKRADAASAQLAELHAVRVLLGQAADVVRHGWVQRAWFTVDSPGGPRAVMACDVGLVLERPVTGACLVGAVVEAAGGPATVRSQVVQRTLDLLWHTLREDPARPVRWCPGPRVRQLAVLELTWWNDAPRRTQGDVVELLERARRTADVQRELCLAERG